MKQLLMSIAMGGAALAYSPAIADTCSGDISNKTLKQLEVTGSCFGDNVTVTGGVLVDPSASLLLTNSTVYGGNRVNQGSLEFPLPNSAQSGRNEINGGIVIYNPPAAFTLSSTDISGQLSISGGGCSSSSGGVGCGKLTALCSLNITGSLILSNSNLGPTIGTNSTFCPGNKINGSVIIDNSRAALFNNTIKGGLFCINGGVIIVKANNNIFGKITCAGF
jgi:hypothetical protein